VQAVAIHNAGAIPEFAKLLGMKVPPPRPRRESFAVRRRAVRLLAAHRKETGLPTEGLVERLHTSIPGRAKPSFGAFSPATRAATVSSDSLATLLVVNEDAFDDLVANQGES